MKVFPQLTSTKHVQSFLGLAGYFRKYIPHFATVARPLSQLLRSGVKFSISNEEQHAFEKLKGLLSQEPVLKLYRIGATTELHTDACKQGLGAILLQEDSEDGLLHPVYFASWKTSPTEEKYSSYELEILAVVRALKKFRVYLLGSNFKIVTDCKAFVQTMSKKDTCLRIARWALQIEEFNYSIEHRPGSSMRHVDALSRYPVSVNFIQERSDGLITQIQEAQKKDPELLRIMEEIQNNGKDDFTSRRGVLYKYDKGNTLLVIPKSMEHEILQQAHGKGHFG